eukprot:TRINITY_DN24554_c0_g1_i1.p1 TRINITY_DN24554_c0_g1~~TRINITY_DN24554_c0_g1_i1.p1  ORF type:complete len:499 (+),score=118.10 TRINITY_DN24554_c0_g1_i1:49-1545(+)
MLSHEECVEWLSGLSPFGGSGEWTLDATLELLSACGCPHLRLPPVVHVTGTNGKGSVVAMLEYTVKAHGGRVMTFTSPHTGTAFDREMRVDGDTLSSEHFRRAVTTVRAAIEEGPQNVSAAKWRRFQSTLQWMREKGAVRAQSMPSQFEVLTCVAFVAAADAVQPRPDVFIVEVGLGGRVDATNAMPPADVCVFTRIGLDHVGVLGRRVQDIAREKSGIVKPGCGAVVTYPLTSESEVLRAEAASADVPWVVEAPESVEDSRFPVCASPEGPAEMVQVRCPLPGDHQRINATIALQAYACLRHQHPSLRPLCAEATAEGFRLLDGSESLRGRFETYALPEGHTGICDGAHNEDATGALCTTIEERSAELKYESVIFVLGMLRDKDIAAAAQNFARFSREHARVRAEAYVPVAVDNPRSLTPGDLGKALARAGVPPARLLPPCANCTEAMVHVSEIVRRCSAEMRRCAVVVTGSFFLLSAGRAALHSAFTCTASTRTDP